MNNNNDNDDGKKSSLLILMSVREWPFQNIENYDENQKQICVHLKLVNKGKCT